jgi:hypothetical protein
MSHPYSRVPDYALWRRAFEGKRPADVDPVVAFPFRISRTEKVATAGSCFAQHLSRSLTDAGFSVLYTEPGHPLLDEAQRQRFGYGVYTARYGNVYTSRQLLQLLQRALGRFSPADGCWNEGERFIDPYRPHIQPDGFSSLEELEADRRQHLAAVRRAMAELDVLVFTLGLTEVWLNRADGAAYPLCPGVAGGTFDASRHAFVNLGVEDVTADLSAAIALLREVNPRARVILTVSPVPLIATAEDRHALVSNTYSKSVLRVAAETAARSMDGVGYFPSYEVVTGGFSRGLYLAQDLRSVTEAGVRHVMSLFFRHVAEPGFAQAPVSVEESKGDEFLQRMDALNRLACEEELLDPAIRETQATKAAPRVWQRMLQRMRRRPQKA